MGELMLPKDWSICCYTTKEKLSPALPKGIEMVATPLDAFVPCEFVHGVYRRLLMLPDVELTVGTILRRKSKIEENAIRYFEFVRRESDVVGLPPVYDHKYFDFKDEHPTPSNYVTIAVRNLAESAHTVTLMIHWSEYNEPYIHTALWFHKKRIPKVAIALGKLMSERIREESFLDDSVDTQKKYLSPNGEKARYKNWYTLVLFQIEALWLYCHTVFLHVLEKHTGVALGENCWDDVRRSLRIR